jgi:hypothetical protein
MLSIRLLYLVKAEILRGNKEKASRLLTKLLLDVPEKAEEIVSEVNRFTRMVSILPCEEP